MIKTFFKQLVLIAMLVGIFVILGGYQNLKATPITFDFTGTVTNIPIGTFPGIGSGTLMTGSFTFDSDATASISVGRPERSSFSSRNSPFGFTWDLGGNIFNQDLAFVSVTDNGPAALGSSDIYQVATSGNPGRPSPWFTVALVDISQTALSNTLLPLTPPDLNDFGQTTFQHFATDDQGNFELVVNGTLNSLTLRATPIPEPSTLLIFALGMAGIFCYAQQREKLKEVSIKNWIAPCFAFIPICFMWQYCKGNPRGRSQMKEKTKGIRPAHLTKTKECLTRKIQSTTKSVAADF